MEGGRIRNYLTEDQIEALNNCVPGAKNVSLGDVVDLSYHGGIPFDHDAIIYAATATTPTEVTPVSHVPEGWSAHIQSMSLCVNGANAWTGGAATKLLVTDSSASYVQIAEVATTALTGNRVLHGTVAFTWKAPFVLGVTPGYGISVFTDALPPDTASPIYIRVWGRIRPPGF